jgi:hypothetical protein
VRRGCEEGGMVGYMDDILGKATYLMINSDLLQVESKL